MLLGARQYMRIGGAAPGPTPAYWGLCFTAEQANSTVAMVAHGSAPSVNLLYSTDAANWSPFVVGTTTVTLASVGDKVWIKAGTGGNTAFATNSRAYNNFSLNGLVAASGSIMSLINGETETLSFPAISAFFYLFRDCTSLTAAPALPAETLVQSCYSSMFSGCTSLTTAPELPAETLAAGCYNSMFGGCTSLTTAPELPATTLERMCYQNMFSGCTSLTTAPELPAETLAPSCYYRMFNGCSALSSVKVGFKAFGSQTNGWLDSVAASGTFYCPSQLGTNEPGGITRGGNACPEGWTVVNI